MTAPTPRTVLSLKRHEPAPGEPAFEDRLHKVLANAGLGSRRLLEQRIQTGEIRVNAKVAEIGSSVRVGDRVEIDGKVFIVVNDNAEHAQVLVYNKPEGVVTTREDPEGRPTVFEQLPQLKGARWISVGRLDINTTGLLLLTTDGALAHALMHPSSEIEREYVCRIHGQVSDQALENLKAGVELGDGPARFDELIPISRGDSHSWFRVKIGEGRNREVRRMWESQDLLVSRLKRIRYGNVELPRGLLRGQSQPLDAEAVKALRALAGAAESEPSLTLQPLIHQRRARATNEFQPTLAPQQGWASGAQDEARELRAFDRIRDDGPFRPGAKKRAKRGSPGNGNRRDNGPSANRKGPRTPGRKPGAGAAPGNRAATQSPRRGKGRGGAQPQIGVYQPPARTWFAGEDRNNRGGGEAIHANRLPFAEEAAARRNNAKRGNLRNAKPGNTPRSNGNDNRSNFNRGNTGGRGDFGAEGNLPRDDIGNRLPAQDRPFAGERKNNRWRNPPRNNR